MTTGPSARSGRHAARDVTVLLVAAMLLGGFTAMRYGGLWGDSDTEVFATVIRAMVAESQLIPRQAFYTNGYGFPVLATFLVRISGLPVAQLQIFGSALLAAWIVLPAWLAYRELTGSARGATLATILILAQPEFLFILLRGSHEKFTRGLMFLCLYLLVRGLLARRQWRRLTAFILAFYLCVYAVITFNNLMAISFITALGLALGISLVIRPFSGRFEETAATRRRLIYAIGISLILGFLFTFYLYAPARHAIGIIQSAMDQVAVLFLNFEQEGATTNPYLTVTTAWVSVRFYLLVSIANWLLLVLSLAIWLGRTWRWWRNRAWPDDPRAILLWSFYGAFGFLGATSILIDVSGAIAANLQHRMFPSFAMIAAPLVAEWFVSRQAAPSKSGRRAGKVLVYGASAVAIAFLGIVAVIKATNEPAVSNTWQFYSLPEKAAVTWAQEHIGGHALWVGINERIPTALSICCANEFQVSNFRVGLGEGDVRDFLISDIIQSRAERMGFPLPIQGDSLQIYSNGKGDLFHLRPQTPFQK